MLNHESAHNLATRVWGSTTPGGQVWDPEKGFTSKEGAYTRAMKVEGHVTEYASKSPAEDFAETVAEMFYAPEGMSLNVPLKRAAVERILHIAENNPPASERWSLTHLSNDL